MNSRPLESVQPPLIMIIGAGDLSFRVSNLLLTNPATSRLVLTGRDLAQVERDANLARFGAANLGRFPEIQAVRLDVNDIDDTAATIAAVQPDIIFMAASLQSWRVITQLPTEIFEALDAAQLGPWLPMHLTLNHSLMRAVRKSGTDVRVVNAAFPDAVGPVLAKVGLAPTIGIGNVGNIIPALTYGFARAASAAPADIQVRLVAQHYFSHYVPRFGTAGRGVYHLSARMGGRELAAEIPHEVVFGQLTGQLKRTGGLQGQTLTAASAVRVLTAMATDSGLSAHAPAPGGLPGGYPVRVGRDGGALDLDDVITTEQAVAINEECQRADGIERIDDDGTVTFTEPEMAVMTNLLGYACRTMTLEDAAGWAEELGGKYQAFAAQYA